MRSFLVLSIPIQPQCQSQTIPEQVVVGIVWTYVVRRPIYVAVVSLPCFLHPLGKSSRNCKNALRRRHHQLTQIEVHTNAWCNSSRLLVGFVLLDLFIYTALAKAPKVPPGERKHMSRWEHAAQPHNVPSWICVFTNMPAQSYFWHLHIATSCICSCDDAWTFCDVPRHLGQVQCRESVDDLLVEFG